MNYQTHISLPWLYNHFILSFHFSWRYNEFDNNSEILLHPPQNLNLRKRRNKCPTFDRPEHFTSNLNPLALMVTLVLCRNPNQSNKAPIHFFFCNIWKQNKPKPKHFLVQSKVIGYNSDDAKSHLCHKLGENQPRLKSKQRKVTIIKVTHS